MTKLNEEFYLPAPIPSFTIQLRKYMPRLILLGLAVHLFLPQLASLENSLQVMYTMALWVFALAFIAQILSYLCSGYLLHSIVSMVNQRLSILWGTIITLAAYSIGLVAGGVFGNTAATYGWVRKKGVSVDGAGLAGILPIFLNNAIIILLAIFGLIHLLIVHRLSTLQWVSFVIILTVLCAFVGVIIWSMHHRQQFTSLAIRLTRKWNLIRHQYYTDTSTIEITGKYFQAMDTLADGGWLRPAAGAAFNIGFDLLTLYFVFIAAGYSIGPGVLLAGYGLPLLFGKMAFMVPGGVGIVEATMVAMYDGFDIPHSVIVIVILTYRLLSFWLPSIFGFIMAAYLQRWK